MTESARPDHRPAQPTDSSTLQPEPARTPKPQTMLEVTETQRIGPHMVRVFLGGPEFESFPANEFADMYVKLLFNPDGTVPAQKMDLMEARASLPAEQVPVTRTYTIRAVDPVNRELAIDFVTHGDEGLAAPWAQRAQPGDRLLLQGPGGRYAPRPDAFHLLLGDESAVPAISRGIEFMGPGARGIVVIEAESEEDVLELDAPEGVEVRWILREGAGHSEQRLVEAVLPALGGEWPQGPVQVFAHGERGSIKAVRRLLREHGVPKEDLSISAYWALGRTEDRFQAEKKEPIGKIE